VPEELLLKTRPNEDPEVFKYRIANYEAITYGSMNRALDSLNRIVSGVNYSYKVSDSVKDYLRRRVFADDSGNAYDFDTFMQKAVLKRNIEDPNGFLVWLPTGEGLVNDAVKVEPRPLLVYSGDIIAVEPELLAYKACNEYSEVIVDRRRVMAGEVFHILTTDAFYRFEQFGAKEARRFRLVEVYRHALGEVPAIVLGGDLNSNGYFESYFAPYNAFGNQAIRQFSDWQAIMVTSGYPYTEEFYAECSVQIPNKDSNPSPAPGEEEYNGGMDQQAFTPQTQLKPIPRSPYNVIIRKIPQQNANILGEAVLPADIPSKRFIYPDISIAQYSGESWQKLIEMAEAALHLNLGQLNQSGKAKELDKEEHYAMIEKIGNNFFDHLMLNSLRYIAGYLELAPAQKTSVSINRTASFRIKTEEDLVAEIGDLKSKNAPAVFVSAAVQELSARRFSGDPLARRIFEVMPLVDPLWAYSNDEKERMVMAGAAQKVEYIASVRAYSLLYNIAREMTPEAFVAADDADIITRFTEALQPYIPAPVTPLITE
jgi:hypothetical protein